MGQNLVSGHRLEKSVAERTLFKDISFGVEEGDRIGLIGPNGAGKSTLLKIIARQIKPDAGTLSFAQGVRTACLDQVPTFKPGQTLFETLLEKTLDPDDGETLARAYEFVSKMGFREEGYDELTPIESFSGGWIKRAALGRELMTEPTLLLLDEPTNHLDVESIEWLEEYLAGLRCATLTVTHDRYVLNNVSNVIWELDPRNPQGILVVKGDYAEYCRIRDELIESQKRQERKLRNVLSRETEWLRREAAARTTKQKARIGRAEKLIDTMDFVENRNRERKVDIEFRAVEGGPKRLVDARKVSKAYGDRQVFSKLDLTLMAGLKLGLLGRNGAGKSTLIRVLLGQEQPDEGERIEAEHLRVSYFSQKRDTLDPNQTVLKTLCPEGDYVKFGGGYMHIRSYLERFLFSDDFARKKVGYLSGGEQARLLIAQLMLTEANLLVLDEPTNDLDLVTLSILEESLRDYPGALVIVSHDRYFLEQVCDRFIGLQDGVATEVASLEQWRRVRTGITTRSDAKGASASSSGSGATNAAPAAKKKLSYKDQRELETMEATILEAENKVRELEEHTRQSTGKADRFDRLAEAQTCVEQLYARWAELEAMTKG